MFFSNLTLIGWHNLDIKYKSSPSSSVNQSAAGLHNRLSLQPPLLCAFLFSVIATVEVNLPFLFFFVSVLCIYGPVAEMVIGINRILSWVVDTNLLMRLLTSLRLMIEVPGFNLILFGVYLHWNRLRNVWMMKLCLNFALMVICIWIYEIEVLLNAEEFCWWLSYVWDICLLLDSVTTFEVFMMLKLLINLGLMFEMLVSKRWYNLYARYFMISFGWDYSTWVL